MRKKIVVGVSVFLAFVLFIVIIENKDKAKGTDGILKVAYKEIADDDVDKSDYTEQQEAARKTRTSGLLSL